MSGFLMSFKSSIKKKDQNFSTTYRSGNNNGKKKSKVHLGFDCEVAKQGNII